MSSVDGRTLTKNWGSLKGMKTYEETGKRHEADAWMCGRVTMETDFASNKPLKLRPSSKEILKEDFVAAYQEKSFAVAVDQNGKLNWEKPDIDGDHLIVVLLESVSVDYLAYLQETGISYIFGGLQEIDFKLVLQKLSKLFAIKKLLLEGGGHLNGSLLSAGLIDELSFLHMPVADGTPTSPTLFEVSQDLKKGPVTKLKLLAVEHLEEDVLWLRYKI